MEFTCTVDLDKQETYNPAGMLQMLFLCIILFF